MKSVKKKIGLLSCPIPISDYDSITLAHGGGGTLSNKLINKMFRTQFDNEYLNQKHDSAIIKLGKQIIAFTTDSYVIQPIFFPGGDIGKLSIYGTVNDLVAAGSKPKFTSVSFIIEEGFSMDLLWKVVQSIQQAAAETNVMVVTGDTKVVDKGKGDKIFVNTSGIGIVESGFNISPFNCKVGDKIILSGTIAEHGIAILSARESFEFEADIKSDLAPLNNFLNRVKNYATKIRVMRDPTRGGLASCLNEIAQTTKIGMIIDETKIPIRDDVNSACEILGLDPLYIANEGKMVFIVEASSAKEILKEIRKDKLGKNAQIVGEVTADSPGTVVMKTKIGSQRIVNMISGEQLPRIC